MRRRREHSPTGDLAALPRTGEAGPCPDAGVGEHSPLVCEAITCSAPVYVLVFTCGRPGSRNLRRCPTRPAPVGGHRAALFSHPRQVRDSRAPCLLGVRVGPWRCSRDCKGNPLGASFPECTCVPVSQVRGSVCARVWTRRCEFPSPFPVQAPRLHPHPHPRVGPSPHSKPRLPQTGKVRSGAGMCGRLEFRHLHGPPTHPAPPAPLLQLPPSSCSSASTSSPQICGSQPAPGSGLPAPAWPGLVERGGAAEAAPPTQGGEWSAQPPVNSRPGTQPSGSSTVA